MTTISRGSILGAIKYNLNRSLGWSFGDPTLEEIVYYSDIVFYFDAYVFGDILGSESTRFKQYDEHTPDQKFMGLASSLLLYDNTIRPYIMDKKTYQEKYSQVDGLFGSYFTWNVVGLQDSDGNYRVKQSNAFGVIAVNPMRYECVVIKLVTLLKILGIGFGTYYGFKYMKKKK